MYLKLPACSYFIATRAKLLSYLSLAIYGRGFMVTRLQKDRRRRPGTRTRVLLRNSRNSRGRRVFTKSKKHWKYPSPEVFSSILFILFNFSSILKGNTNCMGSVTESIGIFIHPTASRFKLYYIVQYCLDNLLNHSRPLDFFVFSCTMEQSAYNVHKIGVATPTTCASRITSPRMFSCSIKLPCILFYQQLFM
jgi:hypothetical protein